MTAIVNIYHFSTNPGCYTFQFPGKPLTNDLSVHAKTPRVNR